MNRISTAAIAAALLGTGALVATPVLAKDKKQDAAAADTGLKLSPAMLKVAQPAQVAIRAKDYATAEPLVAQAEAAAQTVDEKYVAAALRYDLENGKLYAAQDATPNAPVNETVLAAPLDVLIANPRTPADMLGRYTFRRGALAFNSHQYAQSLPYFQKAKQLGFNDNDIDLLIVKAKMESGDVAGGSADLQATVDRMTTAGQKVPEDYYRYGIARSNKAKDKNSTMAWLARYGKAYPTAKNWRDIAVMYGLAQQPIDTLDKAQKIDLFRLMHDSKSLADQYDYEEYAQNATDRGLPGEAAMVLREGQAAGKLPANRTTTEMLTQATQAAKAEGSLAPLEAKAKAGADGKLASQTADGYMSQGNFTKAAELYRLALSKGGVNADEVNTHLGIALSRSGDKAGAQAAFAEVKMGTRADIAALWTAWLNSGSA